MTTPQPQPHPAPLTLDQALALSDEEIRVRVAKMDGWKNFEVEDGALMGSILGADGWFRWDMVPDYPNSHDALAPVLAGLSDEEHYHYRRHLQETVEIPAGGNLAVEVRKLYDATPRQKAVAVILAKQKP